MVQTSPSQRFLSQSFFQRHYLEVARDLIGTVLSWDGCSGMVVETEAYAVEGDEACHTASRPSTREFVQSKPPGTAYIYLNYGMYWLTNVLVKGGSADGIVLIRALEPLEGIEKMCKRRDRQKLTDLCSGPGKLSMALGIEGVHHGELLVRRQLGRGEGEGDSQAASHARGFLTRPANLVPEIVEDVRIGISKATDFPWRFLLKDNPHVSVRRRAS